MSDRVKIVIGGSAEEMGARFVAAWRRAEAGEPPHPERVVMVENFETLARALTPARLGVLKHLAENGPEPSIKAIAERIGRPYRRVHDDVAALVGAGLVRREGRQVALAAESIEVQIRLAGTPGRRAGDDGARPPAPRVRSAYVLEDLLTGITKDNLHVAHDFEPSD